MKYLRIKKNTEFQKIFKRGKRVFSPYITLLYFPSERLSMAVAVSKKHGKAVMRNRIKRLAREAFNSTCEVLDKPYSLIILPKIAESYNFKDFKNSLLSCFKRINLCEKS